MSSFSSRRTSADMPGYLTCDKKIPQFSKGSGFTCSLHSSSFFGFNQLNLKDFLRYPQKGTTMETIGRV